MIKQFLLALAVSAGAEALAQSAGDKRESASDPAARVPVAPHRSAFEGYRHYKEVEASRWREANDEVGRLGGHSGHVRSEAADRPGAAPATGQNKGHGHHGGAK